MYIMQIYLCLFMIHSMETVQIALLRRTVLKCFDEILQFLTAWLMRVGLYNNNNM